MFVSRVFPGGLLNSVQKKVMVILTVSSGESDYYLDSQLSDKAAVHCHYQNQLPDEVLGLPDPGRNPLQMLMSSFQCLVGDTWLGDKIHQ
jgi:hypothetical protein